MIANMIYSYICLRENNKTKGPKHDLQLHMFKRPKQDSQHDLQLHMFKGPKHDLQLHMFERE